MLCAYCLFRKGTQDLKLHFKHIDMVVKNQHTVFPLYSSVVVINSLNCLGAALRLEVCLGHFFFSQATKLHLPEGKLLWQVDVLLAILPNASSIRILQSAHLFRLSKFPVKLIFFKTSFL